MIDSECNAWLMEINANPSMNMFLEKQTPTGKEKIISELDRYLKTKVLNDVFGIIKEKPDGDYGCFEKILPIDDESFNRMYIWDQIRIIFEKLGGIKRPDFLTASQFCKLGRYP